MATVRGATLLGPDKLEIRDFPMPDIPADGGLVKVEMGGVCGTDVKYLHGKLKVDYPIILGHEILGRVEKLGKNAAAIHHVEEEDVVEVIRRETNGEMCDVVVDVSGNPNAILKSVDCLHRQSTMVLGGLTGDTTVTPMLMDKLVWNEIKLQGCFTADNDATEAALRLIEETKFPVQEMVSHTFPLKEIEKCIRAVGGEIPEMFPTKALINPALG